MYSLGSNKSIVSVKIIFPIFPCDPMLKSCIAMTADSHSINNKNEICKLNNNLKNSLSLLEDLKFADFVFVVQLSFSPCDKNLSAAL